MIDDDPTNGLMRSRIRARAGDEPRLYSALAADRRLVRFSRSTIGKNVVMHDGSRMKTFDSKYRPQTRCTTQIESELESPAFDSSISARRTVM